jgi:signal transduction histidine kinase
VNENILQQIAKQSKKVFFQYNLFSEKFDVLTEAFEQIWGKDAQRIRENSKLLYDTVLEDDKPAVDRCWQQLLKGDPVNQTVRIVQGEHTRFVNYDAYPLRDEAGKVVAVAGIVEEVSEEREFLDYLTEFGHRKNSMLEMVSHDLRGPLGIVKSVAGLLRQDMSESKLDDIDTYTTIIENACSSCTNLINDLLSEEHLRSPEVHVNKTHVDILEQIRTVASSYMNGPLVSQAIELDLPKGPLMMAVDQIKFSQILNNLISNSIKFTPADGRITISVHHEGDSVVIRHQDNGIGIPEKLLPHLFEKYTSSGRPGLKGEESRGLGLSIVKELVRLLGGTIQVDSKEQVYTTFIVTLPLYDG